VKTFYDGDGAVCQLHRIVTVRPMCSESLTLFIRC
jgi:hypothetical protein